MQWQLNSLFSQKLRADLALKAFGLARVPLLFLARPRVVKIDDRHCQIEIPLRKLVKNHLGSLYFGALAIGADTCVGLLAFHKIQAVDSDIQLVFKSFAAQFLKRAEHHTQFICEEGEKIDRMIEKARSTGERVHEKLLARAECQGEVVAEFVLELSLKRKPRSS